MNRQTRLTTIAFMAHATDQLALAALPLLAVAQFSASAGLVGALVAAQSAAWLVVSLPMGVIIDRMPRGLVMRAALGIGFAGAALAGLMVGLQSIPGLGLASFILACGTVVFSMALGASLPLLAGSAQLPALNARIETFRAIAMLAAPFVAGWCIAHLAATGPYLLATVAAAAGLMLALGIDVPTPATQPARKPLLHSIWEGAQFVASHTILRAIALCAIFWNFAFFALLAAFVPFALRDIGLATDQAGLAVGANGAGMLLGAMAAGIIFPRTTPSVILIAGPLLSAIGVVLIVTAPQTLGLVAAALGFMLIGFGPMLWLIMQTTIRQLVTPPDLMGRVTATIQVAIYGVRPLGALAAGLVGSMYGLGTAMLLPVLGFGLSFLVAGCSALARLPSLDGLGAPQVPAVKPQA